MVFFKALSSTRFLARARNAKIRYASSLAVLAAMAVFSPALAKAGVVFDRVEEQTGWQTCGNCGNTGATGPMATYDMARGITSPTEDGSSARFSIGGSHPYADGYWYLQHGSIMRTAIHSLTYQFDVYVPSQY